MRKYAVYACPPEGEKTKAKRRKDEGEKTKRRNRKDEKTKAKRRKDEKTKAKRRKDESEKTKRRKDESEKTKRRKRKDESEKTLNSGLHVFVISLFRLRYFVMSPSLFRYVAFVISSFRLFAFVFSSFRYGAFVMSPRNNEKTKWHKSATIGEDQEEIQRKWSKKMDGFLKYGGVVERYISAGYGSFIEKSIAIHRTNVSQVIITCFYHIKYANVTNRDSRLNEI